MVTKQDLIHSAERVIQEKGLDKLTFKAVAEGAHVTQGTVYYHFKTKEQLLFEVVQSLCDRSWENTERTQLNQGHAKESIDRLLEGALQRCTPDSMYHTLFYSLVVLSLQNPPMRERLSELLQTENAHVTALLERLLPGSGLTGKSLEYRAVIINALIDGLALQSLVNPQFPAREIYSELSQVLLATIPESTNKINE
ncbi:TetR/AcrR family transcriptional regulator [Paenibacillus sp. A14]